MKSLKGQFLLDGGALAGSPFHRTVVLICQHDANGAFGLVLNRPSQHTVEEALDELLPVTLKSMAVYIGGPVQPQALTCLIHDPTAQTPDTEAILPSLRMTHSLHELETLSPEAQIKFFAGYSGWSPGQLDNEMKRKAWLTHPAALVDVFHPKPEQMWKTIVRTKGLEYRLLADAPDNLSNN